MDQDGQVVFQVQETLADVSGSFIKDPESSGLQNSYGLGDSLKLFGNINPNDMCPIFGDSLYHSGKS